jgi:hypothetical protein
MITISHQPSKGEGREVDKLLTQAKKKLYLEEYEIIKQACKIKE